MSSNLEGMLSTSAQCIPRPSADEERPGHPHNMANLQPSRASSSVPQSFPTQVSPSLAQPPVGASGGIFERMDPDTLFYIFYYQQGTIQQYMAARELKRQSWRFHTSFGKWFQRHEEPQTISSDYEQGTYICFDHDGDQWTQHRRTGFTFEYRYLEDDLQI